MCLFLHFRVQVVVRGTTTFGGFNYSNDGDSCLGKREELELVMTKKTYFK